MILALRRTATDNKEAIKRGLRWLEGMQCKDGGWGAFDADNTRELVNKLPFCDFGAVIDPPSADVTAHIVEAFAAEGLAHETRLQAGRHLAAQAPGGRRLLVRPLGRELPLRHRRGRSRADRRRGQAAQAADPPRRRLARRSTRTRTAAGARTCAPTTTRRTGRAGARPPPRRPPGRCSPCSRRARQDGKAVERGIRWLAETQRPDGTWDEPYFTGTGFPGDFYLNYHLYRLAFPVSALGRYVRGSRHD